MQSLKIFRFILVMAGFMILNKAVLAQDVKHLSNKEVSIIKISSYAASGNRDHLAEALNEGLESELTVNEIKEILVHLYAYCGFPRSIRGLQTFMTVLDQRKVKGVKDVSGKEASVKVSELDKYERGKTILGELTGVSQPSTLSGYGAFAPVIDTFLKEHLFADIFERDVLSYSQRELVTISVLGTIGEAEPMLKSHMVISLNVGITADQLKDFVSVIAQIAGKEKGMVANSILNEVLK